MKYQGTKINPSRFDRSQIKFFIILTVLSVFMVLPILYIISTAFKPLDELFAYPPRFFVRRPTLDNFRKLSTVVMESGIPLSRYLLNSIVSSGLAVILSVFISAFAAYILSKKNFKSKRLLFEINTLALMFVPVAVRIPRYLIIEKLGLLDTFLVLVLPLIAMPVGVFLVKQFTDQVPNSLIEAATIDGANDFYILYRIVMPVIKPALVTVAILAFQISWNTAEPSSLYINDDSMRTFAFYLTAITTATGNTVEGRGIAAAASLILFIPNLLIFILMQSKVINTMAYSGIK
ncbi:multiple sugar transport system permease protein [Caldicoprobacter guelmensis]|uniref:carbohydrate ABC transporter permease n=1 Tax=Caldicoprobacter guelmensis TaxID=1170224 RepID=UPI00195656C6|nr:carbohydrate ABC transporter permease [Caldicoprobacter guelmensis]MBM7581580.1 multiple sugar transport system permease protein [Caldicoprobacter guelmensis]